MLRGCLAYLLAWQGWNLKPRERKSPGQDSKARAQLQKCSLEDKTILAQPATPGQAIPRAPGFLFLLVPDSCSCPNLRTVLSSYRYLHPQAFISTWTLILTNPQAQPLDFFDQPLLNSKHLRCPELDVFTPLGSPGSCAFKVPFKH